MFEQFINYLNNSAHLEKVGILLVILIYIVFMLVVFIQIRSMRRLILVPTQGAVETIGFTILALGVILFAFGIGIL